MARLQVDTGALGRLVSREGMDGEGLGRLAGGRLGLGGAKRS